MIADEPVKPVLLRAAYRLLEALVRVLLRYNVSAQECERLVRQAYVNVAAREFGLNGRTTSKSRIAALTGLSRKEVAQLVERPDPAVAAERASPNRAIRVVSAWMREDVYRTSGRPSVLGISGPVPSFESLCLRHSGDVPFRALLRDLERTGIVEIEGDHVRLVKRGFVPEGDDLALLPLFGEDPAWLVQTIDHNLRAAPGDKRFQRKAAFKALDAEGVEILNRFAETRGQALLEEIDALMAPHHDAGDRSRKRFHAGLSVNVFVDGPELDNPVETDQSARDPSPGRRSNRPEPRS